jgi:hypothetical protein
MMESDKLAPARGIINMLVIAVPFWLLVCGLFYYLLAVVGVW